MVNRIIHFILTCLFLVTTTGITLSKHYCGTEMISISINFEAEACCDDIDNSDCCRNETEHFQLKENFVGNVIDFHFQDSDTDILQQVVLALIYNSFSPDLDIDIRPTESPPPPEIKTFLSTIQVFRC
jgi:hypothetical protein